MSWLEQRLGERSTWVGIMTLMALTGHAVPAQYHDLLLQILTGLGGLFLVVMKERQVSVPGAGISLPQTNDGMAQQPDSTGNVNPDPVQPAAGLSAFNPAAPAGSTESGLVSGA